MGTVRQRLQKAIEQQRHLQRKRPPGASDARVEAAFRPVRKVAQDLHEELSNVDDLKIEVEPDNVWIELYDKHLWFSFDPKQNAFVGSEVGARWMEGGLREETFKWDTAEACAEAIIQTCARYVLLADAIHKLRPGP